MSRKRQILSAFFAVGLVIFLLIIGYMRKSPKKTDQLPLPTPVPTEEVTEATIIPTVLPTTVVVATATLAPTKTIYKSKLKWGAYTGWQVEEVNNFESKVGKQMDFVATFVHWGNENELPLDLGNFTKSRGKTLVLFWEAMDYNKETTEDPKYNYDAILRGDWDKYIADFAKQTKNFGGEVILIPFEEMNGDWYPWSGTKNGNSAAKHIAAYRYVKKFFGGINNVKFGWAVNGESSPEVDGNRIMDFYPGNEAVDILGINGFNFDNPWVSFARVFNDGLETLETLDKPIMIFSMACADGQEKANWIKEGLGKEIYKHPKVQGFIWFNENKEKDWRVWSDTNSLEAFKSILN
ncbi:MAG: glycosyl hydrolase [Candidatus Shapirobacteria bacterium]|jgi:hypothetical protein